MQLLYGYNAFKIIPKIKVNAYDPSRADYSYEVVFQVKRWLANSKAPKKSKYVPIEEWDEQLKNGENMSAEERLQWECQRNGNQFRQNEILSHHLNSF